MKNCINKNSRLYTILSTPRNFVKADGTKYDFNPLGFTEDEITDVWIKISSKEFEQWYGKGKLDSYDQPILDKDLYLINDKGEQITIIELKNSKDWSDLEEIFKNQGELEKLSDTLKVLKTALLKRLSKYKNVGVKTKAQHKEDLQQIISDIETYEDTDSAIALTHYAEYVSKTFGSLKAALINLDSVDISKLSEEELKKHEDRVISTLLQANAFLQSFEPIEKLDELNNLAPGIGVTLKILKDLESKINTKKHEVEARIKKEIVKHFKGLSSNPEILEGVVDFMASTTDNTLQQTWLDSMGDSQNPILASVDKLYKRTLNKAGKEIRQKRSKWNRILKKFNLNSEADFNRLLDIENGKFLEEYNEVFYERLSYHNSKIKYVLSTIAGFDKMSKEKQKEILKDHKIFKEVVKEKTNFTNENAIVVITTLPTGEKRKKYLPNKKHINQRYAALSDNERQAIKEIRAFLEDLTSHTDTDYFKKGYIPAFNKAPKKGEKSTPSDEEIISEEGNIIRFLSLPYVNKLNQTPLPKLGKEFDDAQFEERQKLIAENRKEHGKSVSTNVGKAVELFIQAAVTHKHKKTIENKIRLVNENLKHLRVIEVNGRGNPIIDKTTGTVHEKDFKESNLYKQWQGWVEGVFYEDFAIDEGTLSDVVNKLTNTTSFLSIGFNVLSAINNKITGNIQLKIEAAGKQYFDSKEYANARWLYFKNITNFIANMDKDTSNTVIEAFIKEYEIYQEHTELIDSPTGNLDKVKAGFKKVRDKGYLLQKLGEHQIQNTALLAMIQSHRVIDGKIMSFFDFKSKHAINAAVKKMQEDGVSSAEIKDYISKNKIDNTKVKEEFEKHPSMLESFELVDGMLQLKKDIELSEDEIFDFKEKVQAVNQKLHGAYNNEDAAMMQRYALGRLAMQFRKWMPNAWNRRFGAKFGKSYWNERRKEYNEGMYISFGKFVASPFVKTWKDYKKQEQKNALGAFKAVLKGFGEGIFNAKIHWHSMSEQQKVNIRRTGMEMALLIAAIVGAYILKGLGDDDDDNFVLAFALQQANRSYTELAAFNFGILTEGKSLVKTPFATMRTLDNLTKLGWDVIAYPFRNDSEREFSSGIYNNHSKVKIRAAKIFFPPYVQLGFLEEKNDSYGLKW